jgi:hypothetical protein
MFASFGSLGALAAGNVGCENKVTRAAKRKFPARVDASARPFREVAKSIEM